MGFLTEQSFVLQLFAILPGSSHIRKELDANKKTLSPQFLDLWAFNFFLFIQKIGPHGGRVFYHFFFNYDLDCGPSYCTGQGIAAKGTAMLSGT